MPITLERVHKGRIAKAINKLDGLKGIWFINVHGENIGRVDVAAKSGAFVGFLIYYREANLTGIAKARVRMHRAQPHFHGTSVKNVLTMAKKQIKLDLGSQSARLN